MTTNVSVEERVSIYVTDLVKVEAVEEAFNLFLVHRSDLDEANTESAAKEWLGILKEISTLSAEASTTSGQQDVALRVFVQAMAAQKNERTLGKMRSLLERSVGERVVSARQVCDVVLSHDFLKYENELFWTASFQLVRRVIGGVDYKGVREIMKACIDKVITLPSDIDPSASPQLSSIQNLLGYIFDRNAALLPGYFIVNEILKSYPEQKTWPHWTLVPMVSAFLNSFRPTAQMVTSVNRNRMRPVVEQTGKAHVVSTWKLDPNSLKFLLKGSMTYERILPYSRDIVEPQKELLLYVLRQPYAKEMVNSMLGLQKPRKDANAPAAAQQQLRYPALEEQLVQLYVRAMIEESPREEQQILWRTLASELIFFILFQYVNFASFIERLCGELRQRRGDARLARDDLMWALLQYISGSIAKNTTAEFSSVLKLFGLLYDDVTPLPVPDTMDPDCVQKLAAAAVYVILSHKSRTDGVHLQFALPAALIKHHEFLSSLPDEELDVEEALKSGFLVPVLINTYSTAQDIFQQPMAALAKSIGGGGGAADFTVAMPGTNCLAQAPSEPLTMEVLDALSVHSKMSLIHSIVTYINKQVAAKSNLALSPALVETYCRLVIYPEIESLGIKGFLNNLLPQIFKQSAWGVLHMLLEIFSYRLHHVQAHFRLSLLSHLQNMVGGSHPMLNKNAQLNLCIESTTLRLIMGEKIEQIRIIASRIISSYVKTLPRASAASRAVDAAAAKECDAASYDLLSGPFIKNSLRNIRQSN